MTSLTSKKNPNFPQTELGIGGAKTRQVCQYWGMLINN